jgi:hypothetical protein
MGKSARIVLATPIMYILLPEVGIAWVDRLGPGRAVVLMAWLSTASIALALTLTGGIVCLLVKRLKCWRACSPGRA